MSEKPSIISDYTALLRSSANFRNLWYGQIISQLGDWFNLVGSAALIEQLTNSDIAIGGLFIARMLPAFVLSPITGVIVDRFDRRKILIFTDLSRAVVVLGMFLVRDSSQIWLLYIITVLQFSISALWMPARSAILPEIIEEEQLITANALLSSTFSTMLALGAAAGGLVTWLIGIYPAFITDSLTFIVSVYFIWRIIYDEDPSLSSEGGLLSGLRQYVDGLRYLLGDADILMLSLLKATGALTIAGGMQVVQVRYAAQIFPLGENGGLSLGLMYAVFGIGTGLAPVFVRQLVGDGQGAMRWTVASSFAMNALGMVVIALAPTLGVMLFGMLIRGVGGSLNWMFSSALLLLLVPEDVRGRVFAFEFAAFTLGMAASVTLGGLLLENTALEPRSLTMLLAVAGLVGGIPWTLWVLKNRANLAPEQPEAVPGSGYASD